MRGWTQSPRLGRGTSSTAHPSTRPFGSNSGLPDLVDIDRSAEDGPQGRPQASTSLDHVEEALTGCVRVAIFGQRRTYGDMSSNHHSARYVRLVSCGRIPNRSRVKPATQLYDSGSAPGPSKSAFTSSTAWRRSAAVASRSRSSTHT